MFDVTGVIFIRQSSPSMHKDQNNKYFVCLQNADGCVRRICFADTRFNQIPDLCHHRESAVLSVKVEKDSLDRNDNITVRDSTIIKKVDLNFLLSEIYPS